MLTSAAFTGIVATRGEAPAHAAPTPAPATIVFGPTPPSDIANPADPIQAATFAWQEFIALTWPARPNPAIASSGYFRGQPDPGAKSGSTGPGGVTVWETFHHRAELYPGYANPTGNLLPDPNSAPSYIYPSYVTINAAPGVDQTLFNNADEASEITIAHMYYTPLAKKADQLRAAGAPQQQIDDASTRAAIVYEAKGNGVIFNYLKQTGFNNLGMAASGTTPAQGRTPALANSILKITNQPYQGPVFELPNGATEIKATWRRYDSAADDLDKFHWAKLIYYTGPDNQGAYTARNDIFLLVGLHIIQKTPNVPTFTFATFEHVSNEANGFRFINVGAKTCLKNDRTTCPPLVPRDLPDPGIIEAKRQFPIPAALAAFNGAVQSQIRRQFGQNNVWANYQLIGVQATVQNDPGGAVPPQIFFLSNLATETNDTLQFFQGGLAGPGTNVPNPNAAHVFKAFPAPGGKPRYRAFTAGGCLGCHGSQGQFQGGDFSVIAATGNFFQPEGITPYPGGPVTAQNPKGFPLPHQPLASSRQPAKKKGS